MNTFASHESKQTAQWFVASVTLIADDCSRPNNRAELITVGRSRRNVSILPEVDSGRRLASCKESESDLMHGPIAPMGVYFSCSAWPIMLDGRPCCTDVIRLPRERKLELPRLVSCRPPSEDKLENCTVSKQVCKITCRYCPKGRY